MNPLVLVVVPFLIKTLVDIGDWLSEGFKPDYADKSVAIKRVAALVIGLGCAFAFDADLLKFVGLPTSVPFLTLFLSGLMFGRGGNVVNDFLASKVGVTK